MSEYALLLILTISFPLLASFEKRVFYFRRWPALFTAMALTATPFIIWDVIFTRMGVWEFNEAYTGSVNIASLPLEEWLFFFAIPFSCIYIYCWVNFWKRDRQSGFSKNWTPIFYVAGLTLIGLALVFNEKIYTLVVFALCGLAMIDIGVSKPLFIKNFLIAFVITLLPFFLVNGYLTAKPVVLYDNAENLGIRLGTVPFEDLFYCFLLLYMNTRLFELFSRIFKKQAVAGVS